MLSINNIEVVYDRVILVLKGVSIDVREGAITTLLGANGAGKTTTLKAISGVLRSERGEVTKGAIELADRRIDGMRAHEVAKLGLVQVFEGRRVFEHLTTEENLIAGGHVMTRPRSSRASTWSIPTSPGSRSGGSQQSGYLSGGEQQMLAIGRALMSRPQVVLLDEPSLGLAPMLVEEIFGIVGRLVKQEKLSVLLVEQNAAMALAVADHGYVMENGRIVLEGPAAKLRDNSDIKEFYLGLNEGGARKVLPRHQALQAAQTLAILEPPHLLRMTGEDDSFEGDGTMTEIDRLREMIDGARRIVAFTGAGISTESGIPDFRSPGGIWNKYQPIYFDDFMSSEEMRREAWRRKFATDETMVKAEPNAGHRALAKLVEQGRMTAIITQNIDGLHQRSGVPSSKIIELHGNTTYATCLDCGQRYELAPIRKAFEGNGYAADLRESARAS